MKKVWKFLDVFACMLMILVGAMIAIDTSFGRRKSAVMLRLSHGDGFVVSVHKITGGAMNYVRDKSRLAIGMLRSPWIGMRRLAAYTSITIAAMILFAHPGNSALAFSLGAMPVFIGDLAPFPVTPEQNAVAISYKNPAMIADNVLQRVPVGKKAFKHRLYDLGEAYVIQDTTVGRLSKPNQVTTGFTESDESTIDHALDEPVPQEDMDNAPANYSPINHATEYIQSLVALDREKRTADLVLDESQYAATNKTTLSGDHRWSKFDKAASGSDPVEDITVGLDACPMRPQFMAIGRPYYSILCRHPNIIKAVNRTSGDAGIAARQAIADLFELNGIFVGNAWASSTKDKKNPTLYRLWGLKCLLFYADPVANTMGGITFGYTAQFGNRFNKNILDPDIGALGGVRVRSGESVKELISAPRLAYLISEGSA